MSDEIQPPACAVDDRRADLLSPSPPFVDLNGIDFVEVDPADHRILRVTFLKPVPAGGYGVPANPALVSIAGGTRIVGITAEAAVVESASVLRIDVDQGGDYSPYVLSIDSPQLDPVKRGTVFSFMASCPSDVDCRPAPCPPAELPEPLLDYLAKDYSSFRQLLLDLLPTLNPEWLERNPSDLGIALVELLAYTGDHLSYYQDAVANEAYLDTLRTRISARRHARLIDYRMHDGRNAWAPVHFTVTADGSLPRGAALFTRITAPLRGQATPPPVVIDPGAISVEDLERVPALQGVAAFESAYTADLHVANNEIRIHSFGEEECCLDAGSTEAYLYAVPAGSTAVRPSVAPGDYLVFEEAVSPRTGAAADADPQHRQLVLVETVDDGFTDPLYSRTLSGDALTPRHTGQPALPLLRVIWRRADALSRPFCLSARLADGQLVRNVSVVRGNIVLADHGLTTSETVTPDEFTVDSRMLLTHGPLTAECRPTEPRIDPVTGRIDVDRRALDCDVRDALPALALLVTGPGGVEQWTSAQDLLESGPFDQQFVAEVDDQGRAVLRFGDGEYGRALGDEVTSLEAVYRVGNGRAGNVGRDAIFHVELSGNWIQAVRNPIPATGGTDLETIEEVRQLAPQAFHSELFRAVTAQDWAQAARRFAGVAGAVATYRWTGSWTTIFVAVDPSDRRDLVDLPNGRTRLEPAFEQSVRAFLGRFRIVGYDIELRPPRFAALELVVEVCARHGYFATDVAQAVRDALSARVLPDDGTRGFFHPDNFTFGDPVYISRLYAAIERVEGVDSAAIRRLCRFGQPPTGELERGVLRVGPWEVARLDADPSFPEHGVLTVTALGGKA